MKDPSLFFSAPLGSNGENFSDNNGDRPLSPRDKHERRLVGRRRDPANNWRGALKERRNRLRIRLRPQARGAQPLSQPLRQPPTWGSPSAWRPDLRRVSLGVGGAAAPIPMSSDQQEEVYDNVQDIHQESRVTGGDVSLNANAATHGHSADQPPRVYEMDAFRTKEDAAAAQDSAAAADSSYESYDKVPSEAAEGKYPAARPGSKYGAPPPTAGKYPSAISTEVKAEGKYPAAVPGSHYGAPPVEAEPTWQEHPWVQPVTPLPFAIDPPRLPFRPRPVIIDTCNCAAYNTFGAAAGTTALVLNAVLFVLLAIANGGSGRSQVSARDKSKYEAHFGGGDEAEGVMAALPPLSPEISHQALRFACDLMGFTQPDYGGHDNFVLSKPTDLNAALHNITHAVAIGDGLYGDPSQNVHLVQGPPGGDVIIQEKPQGVQIITAGSSVNMQGGTPGGSQVSPGIMVVRPVNQASTGSRPSPGTTIQVLGGSTTNTNVNCNGGLCIETVSGVLPVDASPSPSSETRPTSQTIARPPGIVTMASFQPGSGLPPEQIVSLGESGPAEVLPGEILTDIASLPGEDQPRPPGIVGLPVLQGMANVVLAGGETNTGAPGGSSVPGVSPTSATSRPSQGAVDSPASVESLLQNLLSASGITNGPTGQLTRPEVTDPTPLPPNRLSTPSPPPPVPTSSPSLSPISQIPSQLPGVSQPSLPSDVTNGIISNINCLISGMVDGDGLGVVERPCVLPSRPPPTSSGAPSAESAVQPPLEPIAGVFVTPPSHVITDGLITVGSDGVMTTTFVGEGTWFAPTDPSDLSTGVGQPASTGSRPSGGNGAPEDGDILITDISGGITEEPENAELPDFIGGDGASAGITPDSVDISSTVEILSTLGTVEDLEEIPLKGGYFELHIHPTQPIPAPTPSELEFRFPPITIITTTYPSSVTLTAVRGPAPLPTRTLQLTPSVTRLTTITTMPPYYANPTPSSANPTTSWGDEIVYNDLGFWKPPTRQPPSFLTFKRKSQPQSNTVHLDLTHGSLDPSEEDILESLLPGVDDEVYQTNTPAHSSVPEDNPFAGEPEPTELADLFSQLEPSAPIDNSPDDVINIQQIDPTAPMMMMMMAARLNLTNSPIISVLPKPPFLVPAGLTPTTTLITIGGPSTSTSTLVTGSTGYIPPGSGLSSGSSSNPGTGTSTGESVSQPGIFISLQQQNGGTSNYLTNGDHASHPSGSIPFQTVSGVIPVTKKPDRLSTWTGYKRTTTTAAPLAFQSGGWFNLFEVPTTTEKPKFNKMGFWKPTRRPLIFNRMKYKQIRKGGSVSSSRVHLLGRHKDNGNITADEDSSPGYEEEDISTTTQRPSSSPLTGKPGTSTLPPRITTADITYAAAEGSLPSLIQSLFSKPNAGYPNSPDTQRVTKPQNPRTSKPSKRPSSPTTTEPATVTSGSPPSPSPTPIETAAPTPRFNKFGFWKPTKRPYSSMMRRIRQRMKDRTRPPAATTTGTTKAPAPPPVGPPTLPPRRSFVNGNFLPDQKWSHGYRGRRDLSPPTQETSSSPMDAVPASMEVLLDSVGRNFGAASGVQSSSEARMFRHQFRPAGRHRRQFSGRCITRCWLGTVGILGGFGGLAALSVPVYLLLVGSLGGSGTGAGSAAPGGLAGAVAGAAAAAGGVVGVPFAIDEPIPVTGPVPIVPNPVPPGPIPIPLPLPDPLPPDVPSPKPPGTPDEPKPPAPPDTGTGLPPGVPEEETAKPPAPPTIDTDTAAPGPFIEGPDKVVTTFVNVDPAEGENVGGTAVPPETTVFIEQISQPGTRPDPIGVIGIPQEPDRISAVLGQNFGPETAECKNYKLCILHAKTQDTSKRKPPRWFFTTYLYEGTFASLCQQMARKPTTELCRKLFPHCINTTKFGLGY